MQADTIRMFSGLWTLGISLLVFFVIVQLGQSADIKKKLWLIEEYGSFLARKSRQQDWYRRTEDWIGKKGARFHFGRWLRPEGLLTLEIILFCAGFVAGVQLHWLAALAAGCVFVSLPRILIVYMNYKDNEKMLPELKLIYHGLEIQIRAGVYLTDALTECYTGIRQVRLQQALLDLAGAIMMKADIYEAMEQFHKAFDNRYVDALCITLIQALESGQAVELLGDIAEQVKDMELSVMARRKGALDRSLTFYQLGILAAVLGMVLYACVTEMFQSAVFF